MFKTPSDLSDVVSAVIYCVEDSTYFLTQDEGTTECWIPSYKARPEGWRLTVRRMLKEVFNMDVKEEQAIKVYRVWLPSESTYINHVVYKVPVALDIKKKCKPSAKFKGKIRWTPESEIVRMSKTDNLKSPELVDFLSTIKGVKLREQSSAAESWPMLLDYSPLHMVIEILERNIIVQTEQHGNVPLTPHEQLVKSAGFDIKGQIAIYEHFLTLCFPAMYMNKQILAYVLMQIGWQKDQTDDLFRAGDIYDQNGLSFRDYLYLIAALEPGTTHGGPLAELRCHYLFSLFDKNKDWKMEYIEFKSLILMIRKSRGLATDAATLNREAEVAARNMGFEPGTSISLKDFVQAVGELKIRGTSVLLRSPKSLLQYVSELIQSKPPSTPTTPPAKQTDQAKKQRTPPSSAQSSRSVDNSPRNVTNPALENNYELAIHTVKLKKTGQLLGVDALWKMDTGEQLKQTQNLQFSRLMSVDSFNLKSLPNELLTGLHYFSQPISPAEASKRGGKGKEAFTWGQIDPAGFGKVLVKICSKAEEVCSGEPRMLEITSPVYVFGDIHGNFPDLIYFEKVLWHLGPTLTPSTLLFLGDYVDRGPHGVEVVAYLFAYKVQNPTKMKLLRGNHEIRDIQKMFTFFNECICKFGEALGKEVWNSVNNVFDSLPVAALIDNKVFCCHGGIPPPWLCPVLSAINCIPCPMPNPDEQSALAWDIMWNDPVRTQKLPEATAMELLSNDGFATNTRRGTAHVFSVDALERFLLVNSLSHVIRAHEVQQAGFQVQQKGKLLTVFSSSQYCGGTNEAACVLAYLCKLRVFRIDTSL